MSILQELLWLNFFWVKFFAITFPAEGCQMTESQKPWRMHPPHNEQFATETRPSQKKSHLPSPFFFRGWMSGNQLQISVNPDASNICHSLHPFFRPRRRFNINSWCLEPSSGRKMFTKSGWPSTSKASKKKVLRDGMPLRAASQVFHLHLPPPAWHYIFRLGYPI